MQACAGRDSRSGLQAAIAAIALAVTVPCARETAACVTCAVPSDALTPVHPRSLDIALATRAAIEAGLLPPTFDELRDVSPDRIPIGAQEAPTRELLKQWLERLPFKEGETEIVHFLLVDTKETLGVDIGNGTYSLQGALSAKSDATVVTTRHVLHAIACLRLDLKRAKELGVLRIEGELPPSLVVTAAMAEDSGLNEVFSGEAKRADLIQMVK